jgi:hypothetical protein
VETIGPKEQHVDAGGIHANRRSAYASTATPHLPHMRTSGTRGNTQEGKRGTSFPVATRYGRCSNGRSSRVRLAGTCHVYVYVHVDRRHVMQRR